ncbi:hypothetical protein ABWH96_10905 [Marivirga tractuosa]|uniref:hypothetical protein n=1 Tax=Marivirga tractuosa TaxID=1006 RepID=UPI0035CEAE4B
MEEYQRSFFKTSDYFYFSEGILFRYSVFKNIDNKYLKGFWGMNNLGNIYFKPIEQLNCPAYIMLDRNKEMTRYSSKALLLDTKCSIYAQEYTYQINSKNDFHDVFSIKYHMLPLDGVRIKKSVHEENASTAEMVFSITKGIVSLKYEPNVDYTILPWAIELVSSEN